MRTSRNIHISIFVREFHKIYMVCYFFVADCILKLIEMSRRIVNDWIWREMFLEMSCKCCIRCKGYNVRRVVVRKI